MEILLGSLPNSPARRSINSSPFWFGLGFPRSKKVPLADSSNSIRSPSGVTLISIWSLSLSKIEVHQLIELECFHSADCHTHAVAEKVSNVMVFQKLGIFGKNRALVRGLHIRLKRHEALPTGFVQKLVSYFERFHVALLRELRSFEHHADTRSNLFQDVQRIRDQDGTCPGAADDEQFRRLQQDLQVAVLHQVSADHPLRRRLQCQ